MLIFADGNERVHALYFKYHNSYFASLIFKKKKQKKKKKNDTCIDRIQCRRLPVTIEVGGCKIFTEFKQNLK